MIVMVNLAFSIFTSLHSFKFTDITLVKGTHIQGFPYSRCGLTKLLYKVGMVKESRVRYDFLINPKTWFLFTSSDTSLMNIINNMGPITEPCGTSL